MNVVWVILISLIAFGVLVFLVISTIRRNRFEAESRERIPSNILDALEPKWFQYLHSTLMISIGIVMVIPWFNDGGSTLRWLIGVLIATAVLHGWFFFRTRRLARKYSDQIPVGSIGVFRMAEIRHAGFSVLAGIAGITPCLVGA